MKDFVRTEDGIDLSRGAKEGDHDGDAEDDRIEPCAGNVVEGDVT